MQLWAGQALRTGGGGQPADLVERYCAKLQLPCALIFTKERRDRSVRRRFFGRRMPFPGVAPLAPKTENTAKKVRGKQPSQKSAGRALLVVGRYGVIAAAKHVATAVQEQVVCKSDFCSFEIFFSNVFRQSIGTGKSPISLASACIYLVGQLSGSLSRRSFGEPAGPGLILWLASGVSNEEGSSPLLVLLPAVSWLWVPARGSLEPPRRDGENAHKTRKTGKKRARYDLRSVKEGT